VSKYVCTWSYAVALCSFQQHSLGWLSVCEAMQVVGRTGRQQDVSTTAAHGADFAMMARDMHGRQSARL
jgi:hypothetical protein